MRPVRPEINACARDRPSLLCPPCCQTQRCKVDRKSAISPQVDPLRSRGRTGLGRLGVWVRSPTTRRTPLVVRYIAVGLTYLGVGYWLATKGYARLRTTDRDRRRGVVRPGAPRFRPRGAGRDRGRVRERVLGHIRARRLGLSGRATDPGPACGWSLPAIGSSSEEASPGHSPISPTSGRVATVHVTASLCGTPSPFTTR